MIKSMTGYGNATQVFASREITAEIRSVNNRYLDCNVKMPRAFSFAEDAVKQTVKQFITRGKVDVYISVNQLEGTEVAITLNRPVLEGYLKALKTIAQDYDVRDDVSVNSLSRLPDVFLVEKAKEDEDQLMADILSVVTEALEKYNAMRQKEGQALAEDLVSKSENILSFVDMVEKRSPITLQEYRQKLTSRMEEVLQNTSLDENRILQEAAIYADKIAVDEEIVRLRSHVEQLQSMLRGNEPVGRKLDFLLQEMNRETNTIGSKGNDLEQARVVVEMKSELEKIREQIQNIE
ncbi:MAG: YicC family protein [Oscillospiraceae bacterium]|nr:YicC family protein [Oscillospiraceae bacterium]